MSIEIREVPVGSGSVRLMEDWFVDLPTLEAAAAVFPGTRAGGFEEWVQAQEEEPFFESGNDGRWLDIEDAQRLAEWYSEAFGIAFARMTAPAT